MSRPDGVGTSGVRHVPADVHVPRQRPRPRVVYLVLSLEEPLTEVVRVAARAAHRQDAPLVIAMLSPDPHVGAPCMAALDHALQLARATVPRLTLRVDTVSPHEVGAHLLADDFVVASPRTWSGLPDHVRAGRARGADLHLVEPDD